MKFLSTFLSMLLVWGCARKQPAAPAFDTAAIEAAAEKADSLAPDVVYQLALVMPSGE